MEDKMTAQERISNTLHYLKVLESNAGVMQPEIRDAIDHVIELAEEEKTKVDKLFKEN